MIKETLIISALTATALSAKPAQQQTPAIRGDQAAALLMRVFDKNRDGALDRSELSAVRELMMKRMQAAKQTKQPQAKAPKAPQRPQAKAPKAPQRPQAKAPKAPQCPQAKAPKAPQCPQAKAPKAPQRPQAKAVGIRPEQLTAMIMRFVDKNRNGVLERNELMAARDFIIKKVQAFKGMKEARGAKRPDARGPKGPQKPTAKAPKAPQRPQAKAPTCGKKPTMTRPHGHGKRPAPCMKGKQAPITITIPQNVVSSRSGMEQTITITITNKPAFAPKRAKAGKPAMPRMQCRMMKPQMPMHGKIGMKKCPMVKLQPAVKRGCAKPAMKCNMIKLQPAKPAVKRHVIPAVKKQPAMQRNCVPATKLQPAVKRGGAKPAMKCNCVPATKMQAAKKAPKIHVVRAVRLQPTCTMGKKPAPARRK